MCYDEEEQRYQEEVLLSVGCNPEQLGEAMELVYKAEKLYPIASLEACCAGVKAVLDGQRPSLEYLSRFGIGDRFSIEAIYSLLTKGNKS